MDASIGTLDVRLLCKSIALVAFFLGVTGFALFVPRPGVAFAQGGEGPLHWSAKKQVWDRKNQVVVLSGSAVLSQRGEQMLADFMRIDLKARTVSAQGNCVYLARDMIMQSQSMLFNLDTRTGSVFGGRISTESFTLAGEKISRLGEGRFSALNAEYTTCKDCPQSWSFYGQEVDLTFGSYGKMKNVRGKVGDVPITWFPYLIFPLKTERQTGLLFPRFRFSGSDGLAFVQSFFWAISRSVDMTIGAGTYSARGPRVELEARAAFKEGSATANLFLQRDQTYKPLFIDLNTGATTQLDPQPNRWGLLIGQRQKFSDLWVQTLQIEEVSDANYPSDLGDISSRREAVMTSSFSMTRTTPYSSAVLSLRRFRNRLGPDPLKWDGQVVQLLPSLSLASNERPWIKGFHGGISANFSRFDRLQGAFDSDGVGELIGAAPAGLRVGGAPLLGRDPIRKASRLTVTPSIFTDWTPVDGLALIPSAKYRASLYSFDRANTGVPVLSRGYLLTQLEASTEIGRTFEGARQGSSFRHTIRPMLTYSLIPLIQEDLEHPFVRQMNYARDNGFSGYNFDNYDIIPRDSTRSYNNYFLPLGNSLSLGLVSQLYRKDAGTPSRRQLEFAASQTIDFRELSLEPGVRQPLSRFASSLTGDFGPLSGSVFYFYYPYASPDPPSNRNKVSTSLAYVFSRATRQRVLEYERSVGVGYQYDRLDGINRVKVLTGRLKFSITDSILPFGGIDYNLASGPLEEARIQRVNAGLTFQSVSQCWKATINFSQTLERPGTNLDFELGLNLAGDGFGGSGFPGGF
ncbi:MAG: LPS-assembly protein LptD [Oligoflexia bacterium]